MYAVSSTPFWFMPVNLNKHINPNWFFFYFHFFFHFFFVFFFVFFSWKTSQLNARKYSAVGLQLFRLPPVGAPAASNTSSSVIHRWNPRRRGLRNSWFDNIIRSRRPATVGHLTAAWLSEISAAHYILTMNERLWWINLIRETTDTKRSDN